MSRPSRKPLDRDLYDAVVAEAKSRFDVWPSAYASGWVVKTYKARGGRYGGGDRKTRSGLTKWFGEEWVDLSRPIHDEDGELVGYEPCGRRASDDPAAYPKCRPLAEALRMSPSEVKDAIKRKRAAEAKAAAQGGGRGGRGARAPVRVPTYRANPMREPGDVPGFRIAVLEHQKPGAFKGRIILAAYTDDGQMLAWLGALPATLRSSMSTSSGARAAAFPELDVSPYSPPSGDTTVWEVAKAHAWVNGWGPLLYEALLAFVASKGYSGWVTSDAGTTSNEARAVWRRFSERDDVEFREDVGRNVSGEPIHAMRALPALLAKRAPLLKKLDRRAAYTRAAKQFLRSDANQGSGRFAVAEDEARANPRPDGDALTAWCASDESYAVLDETASAGSSWMAGACVLLAKAIRKRYPEARLVGIETDHGIQHVGARIGDTVYDALGEHDPHAWVRDWLAYEQLSARTLVRVVSLKGTPRSALPDAESPATPADVALVARALP